MRNCRDNCKDQDGNCTVPGTDSLPVQCVGPWVLDKYYFLERYVDATWAARKKFSENNNAVFLDLFAGSGRCVVKNEDREVDNGGLRVINYRKVPFNEYYFIDISSANEVAFRKRVTTRQGCYFRCGDSNSLIENLVDTLVLKDYRYHFAYIDPFGPDGLKFSTIESLAKLKRIDLLIHFPIGSIKRNIPKWLEGDSTILDEFLGTKEWRERIDGKDRGRVLDSLLNIYKEQLLRIGFPENGLKMVGSDGSIFPSLPVVSVRNTKDVELYVLILASKHRVGQQIWNSIIKITPDGQRSLF